MPQPLKDESLTELCFRHAQLLAEPQVPTTPELSRLRLLNQLASVQVDLLLAHRQDERAMLLYEHLEALAKKPFPEYDILHRLLILLQVQSAK